MAKAAGAGMSVVDDRHRASFLPFTLTDNRSMLTVYGIRTSGNCYKLQLLLDQLGAAYRWVDVDSSNGETRTPDFLAKNPNGRVPLLELDDGRRLAESNAILTYLAEGSSFLATERWQRAQTMQWLFFEQYSHEPSVAVARFICRWLPADHARREDLPRLLERGGQAFDVMEKHLAGHAFFSGDRYGIADIALYAYTHCAEEGGFELSRWPRIGEWLARVEAQPGHSPMHD
jgi:glutathione S-transferase